MSIKESWIRNLTYKEDNVLGIEMTKFESKDLNQVCILPLSLEKHIESNSYNKNYVIDKLKFMLAYNGTANKKVKEELLKELIIELGGQIIIEKEIAVPLIGDNFLLVGCPYCNRYFGVDVAELNPKMIYSEFARRWNVNTTCIFTDCTKDIKVCWELKAHKIPTARGNEI